jgi:hypothetical protein
VAQLAGDIEERGQQDDLGASQDEAVGIRRTPKIEEILGKVPPGPDHA